MSATLYVAISSHGYGHIGQTAPVVNELCRRVAGMRVVIECGAPRELLAKRFDMPFEHVPVSSDFGMVMKNAFTVDVKASYEHYLEMHRQLGQHVEAAERRLEAYQADLLFANVPYIPLMGAHRIGLPAIGMSSLNWAHIFESLLGHGHGADAIYREMLAGYRSARAFIAPAPSMEMPGLDNAILVGAIATVAQGHRSMLRSKTGIPEDERVVLVSMGGIATDLDLAAWPVVRGVTWLFDRRVPSERTDMVSLAGIDMAFLDVMASSDALVTKPGYGAFAEAACNGVPVLYVPRHDWPEAAALTRWLHAHGTCLEVAYEDLYGDRLGERLEALWRMPAKARVVPTGVGEAADILQSVLKRKTRQD